MGEAAPALDENLHSRQLAVYGREVMQRMAASNVLISGANGLGLEIGERWRSGFEREGEGEASCFLARASRPVPLRARTHTTAARVARPTGRAPTSGP